MTRDATCDVPVIGKKTGPQTIKVDFDKTTGPGGVTVTATVDLGPPPITSPMAFKGAKAQSTLTLSMSGAATGTVSLAGPEVTLDIAADVPIDPAPYTATFTIPAAAVGDIQFTPTGTANVTDLPGLGKQTAPCTYAGANGVVATFTADSPPAGAVTLDVQPGTVEPGNEITLSGAGWPAGTPTVELCDAAGANCKADGFSAKSPSVANGTLSGKATVAAGTADGDYTVKVSSGDKNKTAPLKVKKAPAAEPKVGIDPSSGPVGTKVKVSGKSFTPNADLIVFGAVPGADGKGDKSTDPVVQVKADAKGEIKDVEFVVKDPSTVGIGVAEKNNTDRADGAAFTVTTPPSGEKPMDPRQVDVQYECKTTVTGIDIDIPAMQTTVPIKLTVPANAAGGDTVDVKAEIQGNVIGKAPSMVPANSKLFVTPKLTVDVVQGTDTSSFEVTEPKHEITVSPGDDLTTAGALTGTFKVWGGGMFSFSPGTLTIQTEVPLGGQTITSMTKCTAQKTDVSAQLLASGDKGTPPPSAESSGGTSATGGDLAKTGSGGDTISAFALVAGTAVLAAVGTLLLVPYRRRRLQARG
ncbi:hypothetical protein QI554_39785 [Yinghuangia seranimata]|nr:hypothetical protein [Yinghuangia seranimata]